MCYYCKQAAIGGEHASHDEVQAALAYWPTAYAAVVSDITSDFGADYANEIVSDSIIMAAAVKLLREAVRA